jgi:ParB family chromosome partitioning protein
MSVGKKLEGVSMGLGAMLDSRKTNVASANKAAPAQLLTFREEMNKYEDRIVTLEKQLTDAAKTEISVAKIEPNPWQPRLDFNDDAIRELADSIAETGLIQPILIRSVPSSDTYQLIAGERRWRAHQLLGREFIKAIIIEAADADIAVMALAENIERQDLTDYEIAKAIRRMEKEFPNRKRLAEAIGIGRQDLYKFLAFDKMPADIKADLEKAPHLLGRNAAEQVAAVLKARGVAAIAKLQELWLQVVNGKLEQSKLAPVIEQSFVEKQVPISSKESLTKDGIVFGSISRSRAGLSIQLASKHLSTDKEARLLAFLNQLIG